MPGSLTGTSVTVTPASTTTYTVTGTTGSCTGTATQLITVTPGPTVSVSATSTSFCEGNSTTLIGAGATTYNWMPGNLTGVWVSVAPATTTTYTVTGTTGGCTGTATQLITVIPAPAVTISATVPSFCEGNSTLLIGAGATTYSWMPGNLTGLWVSVSPVTTTTYTVTGTNALGCTGTSTQLITVNPLPTVSLNLAAIDTQCVALNSIGLTGESPSGGVFSGPGVTGNVFNPSAAGVGTWTITYTYSDVNGCANSATGIIYVDVCTDVINGANSNNISVYPNPVNELLTVDASATNGISLVFIMNNLGQVVYSNENVAGKITIDMSSFANGIYSLQLKNGNSVVTKKIVKQD